MAASRLDLIQRPIRDRSLGGGNRVIREFRGEGDTAYIASSTRPDVSIPDTRRADPASGRRSLSAR